MKPKNCGECLMHKKCGYVVCGECRPHDPPCQRMKLLSACHKQRDRAREYKAHWLKAEQRINRMTQAMEKAQEERNEAVAQKDWATLTGYLSSKHWVVGAFEAPPPDWEAMKRSLNNKGLLPSGWVVTEVSPGCVKLEKKP